MKADDWRRLKAAVARAQEFPHGQRGRALDDALGTEGVLRDEAARIIAASERPGGPLDDPGASDERVGRWQVPARIGDLAMGPELGRGSMGVVVLAWQETLTRKVAVKILPPDDARDEVAVAHFTAEARKAARIKHPSIVAIHSVGFDAGLHYFVMEHVEGHDVGREIAVQCSEGADVHRLLPAFNSREYVPAVARLCVCVALALDHAHGVGLVHRDVKPSNILLDLHGRPHVVDFGIARDTRDGDTTRKLHVEGTPYYMSPEQVRVRAGQVDHRTDVYSLGIVLYEMLTLRRPFEGSTTGEILRKILDAEPRLVRRTNVRVPRDLEAVCLKAIAKNPESRYSSAAECALDLERFLAHEAVAARPVSSLRRGVRILARRWQWGLSAGIAVAAAVTGATCVEHRRDADSAAYRRGVIADGLQAVAEISRNPRAAAPASWNQIEAMRAEFDSELPSVSQPMVTAGDDPGRAARDALDGLGSVLVAEAQSCIERVRADRATAREQELADALAMLHLARRLRQTDNEIGLLASGEALLPRLTVRSLDGNTTATVQLRVIDQLSGEPGARVLLGSLPIEARRVPVGYYRIVIDFGLGRFAECARTLDPVGRDVVIEIAPPRPLVDVTASMVRVESGTVTGIDPSGKSCQNEHRSIDVPAFFLDPSEVTNGEYRRFCLATGHTFPLLWRECPALLDDDQFADRPVVDVTVEDSLAFCDWSCKRLPTHAEWELAAQRDGSVPQALASAEGLRGSTANVHGELFVFDVTHSDRAMRYLTGARPATNALLSARPPRTFEHLLGNVWELTESPCVANDDRAPPPTTPLRIVLGGGWDAAHENDQLHGMAHPGEKGASLQCGFRCAKSIEP